MVSYVTRAGLELFVVEVGLKLLILLIYFPGSGRHCAWPGIEILNKCGQMFFCSWSVSL